MVKCNENYTRLPLYSNCTAKDGREEPWLLPVTTRPHTSTKSTRERMIRAIPLLPPLIQHGSTSHTCVTEWHWISQCKSHTVNPVIQCTAFALHTGRSPPLCHCLRMRAVSSSVLFNVDAIPGALYTVFCLVHSPMFSPMLSVLFFSMLFVMLCAVLSSILSTVFSSVHNAQCSI